MHDTGSGAGLCYMDSGGTITCLGGSSGGTTGTSGTSGIDGTSGTSGAGSPGSSGSSGTSGDGTSGTSGAGGDGTSGTSGAGGDGTSGTSGTGSPGSSGSSGSSSLSPGTADGQMLFWDTGSTSWVHTETDELIWDDTNKYIGVNNATPSSHLDVNGSFGTIISGITSSITLDDRYHTLICANSSDISIHMPRIEDCINREYVICRYGAGNITIYTSIDETTYTEYFNFYTTTASVGSINFETSLPDSPSGTPDSKNILYSITLKGLLDFPTAGEARWLVTNFAMAYDSNIT